MRRKAKNDLFSYIIYRDNHCYKGLLKLYFECPLTEPTAQPTAIKLCYFYGDKKYKFIST